MMEKLKPQHLEAEMNQSNKALILLFPDTPNRSVEELEVPKRYRLRNYIDSDKDAYLKLLESEGWRLNEEHFKDFYDRVLPNGLFILEDTRDGSIVSTAAALHNPNCSHHYFPFGGDIGFVITQPEHRGQGLGYIASRAATIRLINGGYASIRVVTNDHRLTAIKIYLKMGYLPFLYDQDMEKRWEKVCEQVNWGYRPEEWIKPNSIR
ncbi:GNAT family N-acetyltransferase [Paenibacillus sp. PR3]|uniref:GNAT family N-acetyltransferase n=1 Tax=Paenibacillus terricola TaxID=2763503 RepID=A0ABR8MWA1_9BACL|nr:GNAT family N-acetyltransferase [Paenibacillus terricola]MBD3919855.1 GNAT family N-acetyltransferase [Paenibacillus terricola]